MCWGARERWGSRRHTRHHHHSLGCRSRSRRTTGLQDTKQHRSKCVSCVQSARESKISHIAQTAAELTAMAGRPASTAVLATLLLKGHAAETASHLGQGYCRFEHQPHVHLGPTLLHRLLQSRR
jgi:hypothetical protein